MRHLKPILPREPEGLTARVYDQIRRDFGVVPEPMSLLSPVPKLLAAAWCAMRELVVVGRVPRARKEVFAASVSRANDCPFCVGAHTIMLAALGDGRAARGLRSHRRDLGSALLERYSRWAGEHLGSEQPVGRLILLTALAPHRVMGTYVEAFRSRRTADSELVIAAAWDSALASLRTSDWLSC